MLSNQPSRAGTALEGTGLWGASKFLPGSQAHGQQLVSPCSSEAAHTVFSLAFCSSPCFQNDCVSVYKEFTSELDFNCTAQRHKLKKQF